MPDLPAAAPPPTDGATAVRPPARARWIWLVAAVLVAALIVALVIAATRGEDSGAMVQPSQPAVSPTDGSTEGSPDGSTAQNAAWERRDQLQTPRDDFGTVVLDGAIWISGGMTGERGNKLATTEVYDGATERWSLGPPMSTGRSSHTMVEIDGLMYVTGGSSREDGYLDMTEVLDPATGTWSRLAPMPTPRYEHGSVVLDGVLYAIGGTVETESLSQPTAAVEIYDPAADTWTDGPDLPGARTSLRTAVVDGKIYAVGGIDAEGAPSTVVDVYDPAVGAWQPGPALPEPIFNFGLTTYAGELHAIYHEHHFVLGADGQWRDEGSPPVVRHGQGLIELDGLLYAIGGCTAEPLADVNTVQVWQG